MGQRILRLLLVSMLIITIGMMAHSVKRYLTSTTALATMFQKSNNQIFGKRFAGGGSYIGSFPSMLPDGRTIVFGSPVRDTLGDIYSIDLKGNNRRALRSEAAYEGQPSVALHGQIIAFVAEYEEISQIYIANHDGQQLRRVTTGRFPDLLPVVDAPGKYIAFTRHLSDDPDELRSREIYLIGSDGAGEKRLTNNYVCDYPVAFSADGKSLYYLSGTVRFDLHKINIESGDSELVLKLEFKGSSTALSPDERLVAFTDDSEQPFEYEIYVCKLDGSAKRRLTELRGYIESVRFTPDGKSLLFVREKKGSPANGRGTICILDIDSKRIAEVAGN